MGIEEITISENRRLIRKSDCRVVEAVPVGVPILFVASRREIIDALLTDMQVLLRNQEKAGISRAGVQPNAFMVGGYMNEHPFAVAFQYYRIKNVSTKEERPHERLREIAYRIHQIEGR